MLTSNRLAVKFAFGATILLAMILASHDARAATVIYYSPGNGAYGWCVRGSSDAAHGCARRFCIKSDGESCEAVVECGGGHAATAYAKDWRKTGGFGASCGLSRQNAARELALVACMASANDLCEVASTFNGGNTASDDSDREFTLVWMSQSALGVIGYDVGKVDGRMGPKTRGGIAKFQTAIGLAPSGEPSEELLDQMLNAAGGVQNIIRLMRKHILDPNEKIVRGNAYSHAKAPVPERSFSDSLEARSDEERMNALAVILSATGAKCSLPAHTAIRKSEHVWWVDCSESAYELDVLARRGRSIDRTMMAGGEKKDSRDGKDTRDDGFFPPNDEWAEEDRSQEGDSREARQLKRVLARLEKEIEKDLRDFRESFGPEFLAKLDKHYRERGTNFEEYALQVCPIKDNASVVLEADGAINVKMSRDPNKQFANGRSLTNLAFLDPAPAVRHQMIEYVRGILSNGAKLLLTVSTTEAGKVSMGQCMVRSMNKGQVLFTLAYAQVLAESGDHLWMELTGLIYGSGELTYRDFTKMDKFLKASFEGRNEESQRLKKVLNLIATYKKLGGEMLVLNPI